jgi:hypothetical protein
VFFNSIIVRNNKYLLARVLNIISGTIIASENASKGLGHILVP